MEKWQVEKVNKIPEEVESGEESITVKKVLPREDGTGTKVCFCCLFTVVQFQHHKPKGAYQSSMYPQQKQAPVSRSHPTPDLCVLAC